MATKKFLVTFRHDLFRGNAVVETDSEELALQSAPRPAWWSVDGRVDVIEVFDHEAARDPESVKRVVVVTWDRYRDTGKRYIVVRRGKIHTDDYRWSCQLVNSTGQFCGSFATRTAAEAAARREKQQMQSMCLGGFVTVVDRQHVEMVTSDAAHGCLTP